MIRYVVECQRWHHGHLQDVLAESHTTLPAALRTMGEQQACGWDSISLTARPPVLLDGREVLAAGWYQRIPEEAV